MKFVSCLVAFRTAGCGFTCLALGRGGRPPAVAGAAVQVNHWVRITVVNPAVGVTKVLALVGVTRTGGTACCRMPLWRCFLTRAGQGGATETPAQPAHAAADAGINEKQKKHKSPDLWHATPC